MPCHMGMGHPAPLVGKRFLAGGPACILAWIHALFTLILLTHKIMIMFCICVGVPLALWTARFSLLSSKKMENEENSG